MLLDTHIWYRWLGKNDLPNRIIHQIENADELFVSATSCWELAQLVKKKSYQIIHAVATLDKISQHGH